MFNTDRQSFWKAKENAKHTLLHFCSKAILKVSVSKARNLTQPQVTSLDAISSLCAGCALCDFVTLCMRQPLPGCLYSARKSEARMTQHSTTTIKQIDFSHVYNLVLLGLGQQPIWCLDYSSFVLATVLW